MLPRTQNSSINLAIGNTGDGYYFQGGQSGWNLSVNSGDVSLYGGSQILNGQLLIGNSGDNSFEQGYIYGQSGVIVNSGTANLGISIDSSLVVTTGQTGQFYSNQNINNYCTSGNLTNTGINILNEIVSLSGNLLSTGQNLQNQINAISVGSAGVTGISITGGVSLTGHIIFTGSPSINLSQLGNSVQLSQFNPISTKSGSYTYLSTDYVVIYTGIGGNVFTLPDATVNNNRIVGVKTTSTGILTITGGQPNQQIFTTGNFISVNLVCGDSLFFHSDGVQYYVY